MKKVVALVAIVIVALLTNACTDESVKTAQETQAAYELEVYGIEKGDVGPQTDVDYDEE